MSNLRFLSAALVLLHAFGLTEAGLWDHKRIRITNLIIPATLLGVHCKSKDDDLGSHALRRGQSVSWRFRPNIIESTEFFCRFEWNFNGLVQSHWLTIYDIQNNETTLCNQCLWSVNESGVCRKASWTKADVCVPWNPTKQTISFDR